MPAVTSRLEIKDLVQQVTEASFSSTALALFRYQAHHNPLYAEYLDLLELKAEAIHDIRDIPFLPISLFKTQLIQTGDWTAKKTFSSSGTTSNTTSRHLLADEEWYRQNARRGFNHHYGPIADYCVLALLPAYLERTGSSLVFMADDFIRQSKYEQSGFFLHDWDKLLARLEEVKQAKIPTILLGVSFALWDLVEKYPQDLGSIIVMETGGMKGRRPEITRPELHQILKEGLQLDQVHSEYGMTELLSQAYSRGEGLFFPAPTMRVLSREITDPFRIRGDQKTGALNIIDLANLDTISFIATDDLGQVYLDGSFRVLGRLDTGDVRGCNLLYLE